MRKKEMQPSREDITKRHLNVTPWDGDLSSNHFRFSIKAERLAECSKTMTRQSIGIKKC